MEHLEEKTPEQHFGAMVRQAREARPWTQEELRRHLSEHGVVLEKTAMIRLEQGKRPIRLNEVAVLARLLGLDLRQYSGTMPQLTSEEYQEAKATLQRIVADQEAAARRSVELDGQHAELVRLRRDLAEQRARYEWLIGEFEFEHHAAEGEEDDGE